MLEPLMITYIFAEVLISVATLVGNLLVVWAVKVNPGLQAATFYLIFSLAMADVAVGAVAIPIAILISLRIRMSFHGCLFCCCLICMLTQGSIIFLTGIAVDRYLRVKMPVRYRTTVTKRRAMMAAVFCCLLSIILGLIPMMGWHNQQKKNISETIECTFTTVMSMEYIVYFNFFVVILLPLLIMLCLYTSVFFTIKQQLTSTLGKCFSSKKYYQKELKLAKSLVLILLLFTVCWIPLPIINAVSLFCNVCYMPPAALYLFILLSHANSAMNPIVYALRIKKFRVTFWKIWQCYVSGVENTDQSQVHGSTVQSFTAERSEST
ncbi:adenosine receptor A1-like [Erpetoichthys calabaricus]|nr:adenosine receptor A1-like [Erpetoichthys calabaricus]